MGAFAVVHPFPSALNALLVVGLALVAGATVGTAGTLGIAMLGIQFAIGAVNDLVDAPADALVKPSKPLVTGAVSARTAVTVAFATATVGVAIAAVYGPIVLALMLGMLGAGLAYDLVLKRTALAGMAFAVAFALLPVYVWWAVAGTLPPRPELLLPVAALAGPTLQLANGLVDLERDALTGVRGPVVLLGRRRSVIALILLEIIVHGLAIATLVVGSAESSLTVGAVVVAGAIAASGLALSAERRVRARELGWRAQALAIALLGIGWTLSVS